MLYKIFEIKNSLFFEIVKKNHRCHIIYNKTTGISYEIINNDSSFPYGLINDIDSLYPFWPDRISDNHMLMFVSSEKLIKQASIADSAFNGLSSKALATLTIEDNPVIIKAVLKK